MEAKNDLVIAIINRGYSDVVMDIARERGATGGTILHGKGTSTKEMEAFFNISLQEEKEIVLIVTSNENRNNVMEGLLKDAGLASDSKGVIFTIPVADFEILSKHQNIIESVEKD